LAAGNNYSVMIKNDGMVWAWGDNTYGQVGNGTTISALSPVKLEFTEPQITTPTYEPTPTPTYEPTPTPTSTYERTPEITPTPDYTPTLVPTPEITPTPMREIKGTISLGTACFLSNEYISITASNGKFSSTTVVLILSGEKYAEYSIKVPTDLGYKVSYEKYFYNNEFISKGYFSEVGTTSDSNIATLVNVTNEDAEDVNLMLIGSRTISGTLSLPNGEVAPQDGIPLILEFSNTIGNIYKYVTIPSGGNLVRYEINIPPNTGAGYKINCYNVRENSYLQAMFQSLIMF
jgi:hypothetical protein